jgi:hypothetical protein
MKLAKYGMLAMLLVALAVPAMAVDTKGLIHHQVAGPRVAFQCDDGFLDNAYYENQGYVYGNAFSVGAGGPLSTLEFWHYGWSTWSGPSQYNVHVYDDMTCTEIAVLGPYTADDAYYGDVDQFQDLCPEGLNVTGDVAVMVEPLSCASPTDCYPDVYFDQTGTFDGCDRLFPISAPDCSPYMNGDFVLRIFVDECGNTPAHNVSWGALKATYK